MSEEKRFRSAGEPTGPRKGIHWGWWVLIGCGGLVVLLIVIGSILGVLLLVFAKGRFITPPYTANCTSKLKLMTVAVQMYTRDHNGKLPAADKWCDAIYPYLRNECIFVCRSDSAGSKCSYAMNSNLSNKALADIPNPAGVVLLFESTKGAWNANDTGTSIPQNPPRHNGGNNYGFVDGHVKWLSAVPPPEAW